MKIDTHGILEVQILYLDLDFWNSDTKIHFWANLGWKSQRWPFFLKIGMHDILKMLILILTFVFWISDPKPIFGKIWTKKVKVVQLADVSSYSNITFLSFEPYVFFWTNLGQKIQSCSFWLNIGTHGILRFLILILTIAFWIANPKSAFGQIWAGKVQAVCLTWKLAHKHTHMHAQYLEDVDISFVKFQT